MPYKRLMGVIEEISNHWDLSNNVRGFSIITIRLLYIAIVIYLYVTLTNEITRSIGFLGAFGFVFFETGT